ncbi:hypothetical protein KIN20_015014 [Parelaphostrongylus tenuis]|uniref:Uncharacterized protein n=1 Tax=Parelaphostrongylus tenuis TaxID=148309 RepID=A0AAD5ME90_PARTN|nr:hypothetical protein KIN20_015014 [Parelaphostrongylus tenuis]
MSYLISLSLTTKRKPILPSQSSDYGETKLHATAPSQCRVDAEVMAVSDNKFRIGRKAAETTHNISSTIGQELLTSVRCSGGSERFVKKTHFNKELTSTIFI